MILRHYIIFIMLLFSIGGKAQIRDLDLFIAKGIKNNPQIRELENQQKSSEYDKKLAAASYRAPDISVNSQMMEAPVYKGQGYDEAITNGGLYSALIQLKLPLLQGNLARTEKGKIDIDMQRQAWQQAQKERDLTRQITEAYLQCEASQQLLGVALDQQQTISDQLRITREMAKSGISRASDVMQMQVELQNQKLQTADYKTQLKNDYLSLLSLCGITDTSYQPIQIINLDFINLPDTTRESLQQFELDSLLAIRKLAIYNIRYKPRLSAYADAGLNATDLSQPQQNLGYSFGLNLSLTLFDGQQKNRSAQTELALQTVEAYSQYYRHQQIVELAKSRQRAALTQQQLELLETQKENYNLLLKTYHNEMGQGSVSVLDYLITFRSFVQLRVQEIQLQLQRNQAINNFNYWNW